MKEYKKPEFEEVNYSCEEDSLLASAHDNAQSDLEDIMGTIQI